MKLATAQFNLIEDSRNPWSLNYRDFSLSREKYLDVVDQCRFFYRTDPLVSTTINRLVEISINGLRFFKGNLSEDEFQVFTALAPLLQEFAERAALEYLLSGLVVPEIQFEELDGASLQELGISSFKSLTLPVSLWIRDPGSIEIVPTYVSDKPLYYVIVSDSLAYFIRNNGKFETGEEDKTLYQRLSAEYPEFVARVKKGETRIRLENDDLVIRRNALHDNPYPTPYIMPALGILEYKRNLRRADYSIVSKVASAILHVKVGSDEFPITDAEEDIERLNSVREALMFRGYQGNSENVFQLITDHTVELKWIFPNLDLILNDKYREINQEIMFALGFPRILITGEAERSNSSDPEFASLAPIRSMESFRAKILRILRRVVWRVAKENSFSEAPEISFNPINLYGFGAFINGLYKLLEVGGLSRESFGAVFGYNFYDEAQKRKAEQELLESLGIPEFQPLPHSRPPEIQSAPEEEKETPNSEEVEK